GEDDITASTDAFALLEEVVRMRLARGLTTVIDTLGLDGGRRAAWLALARRHGLPCVAVVFDTPAGQCRARHRSRPNRIPADVLAAKLRSFPSVRSTVAAEGFDGVLTPQPVRVVPAAFVSAQSSARRQLDQLDQPAGLRFGLHIGTFGFDGGPAASA